MVALRIFPLFSLTDSHNLSHIPTSLQPLPSRATLLLQSLFRTRKVGEQRQKRGERDSVLLYRQDCEKQNRIRGILGNEATKR